MDGKADAHIDTAPYCYAMMFLQLLGSEGATASRYWSGRRT